MKLRSRNAFYTSGRLPTPGVGRQIAGVYEKLVEGVATRLLEISKLPKEYFSAVDSAISDSAFWTKPNNQDDIDLYDSPYGGTLSTPAAIALQKALDTALKDIGLDFDVLVSSHDTDSEHVMLHEDHPAWPNRWLIDAKWYVSKERPGRNTIDLEIMTFTDDADASEVDPPALIRHIAQTVRHELVHFTQMKKQSLKKGMYNDIEAFKDMLEDPSQIPNENDSKYWDVYEPTGQKDEGGNEIISREGFDQKLYTRDYLHSHIEIDAHAHDAAEELLAVYGHEGSKELLSKKIDLTDPKLPNAIQHYYENLPENDKTLRLLRSKAYSYLNYFKEL